MADGKLLFPDYDEAASFAKNYYADRPRHISVIHDGQPPITRTFHPDQGDKLKEFVERENRQGGNVYFAVNEIAETAWNKKAQKADVTGVTALHCDLDDLSEDALRCLAEFRPPPSIVLCSGGGYARCFTLLRSTLLGLARLSGRFVAVLPKPENPSKSFSPHPHDDFR